MMPFKTHCEFVVLATHTPMKYPPNLLVLFRLRVFLLRVSERVVMRIYEESAGSYP